MHTTENFGLSQFDATDIFNPMTVNNENAQKIDAQMKLNKDASLGIATELVSQGVHALTRLSDYETCNFFKFTATSNYEAGETFVVDGVQVQAKTVAGSTLASGAYIIGSTVLCELRDALLTIFVPGAQTADDSLALNGHPDTYFGTAEDVAAAQATATAAGNLADQNRADIVQLKSNLANRVQLSLDAVAVGKDEDGDTIYEKTFKGSTISSGTIVDSNLTISNLKWIRLVGGCVNNAGVTLNMLPFGGSSSDKYNFRVVSSSNGLGVDYKDITVKAYHFTVQYVLK